MRESIILTAKEAEEMAEFFAGIVAQDECTDGGFVMDTSDARRLETLLRDKIMDRIP